MTTMHDMTQDKETKLESPDVPETTTEAVAGTISPPTTAQAISYSEATGTPTGTSEKPENAGEASKETPVLGPEAPHEAPEEMEETLPNTPDANMDGVVG
ncbi:Ribosomal protein L1p/L10e family protein [Aspergillus niger]|uniref:Ribosomal protein L1p/L10e family protein n=1 Tax=Aspergillus niger TaxID=5061 RepID=A0A505I7G5_ASPNG|nr:Ribosomal protein L1p/L10e family protein [Aspergillus niger]